ncbi:MAG: L,D-transpeptidase family protein [Thermohalobaculum sp.]
MSALLAGTAGAESPVAPAYSPGAEALRVDLALQYDRSTPERSFYEAREYLPVWLAEDGAAAPAARALLSWVGAADANALPASRYGVSGLTARLAKASSGAYSDASALETDLTRLFLAYARDISSGLLEPRSVSENIDIEPRRPDPAVLLAGIGATGDIPAFLDGLAPAGPAYDRLLSLYAGIRGIERNGGWGPRIDNGRTLLPGGRDPRVAQLRARLTALGDLAPADLIATSEVMNDATPPVTDLLLFDPALVAAVRRFQARHGLNTDGIVGPMTLAALNTTATERAAQVAVNLERMRWLNYDLGARHIVINIAAYTMTMIENGVPRFTTRTVVGKSRKFQTPEFNDQLEFIVVNPFWNVPYSIASREILPLLQEDPTYLEQNNMELLGSELPAREIDWSQVTRRSFPGRIRQRPGPDNALGTVKFLFPNDHAIYMHDTPAQNLFAYDQRTFSHGCVRLQDPIGFAHLLLSLQGDDPVGTFDRLRELGDEKWIRVREAIPVYVTYRTAWLDAGGVRQFRADVYRRDRDVMSALAAAGVSASGG